MTEGKVWYVAYGSNMDAVMLSRYLDAANIDLQRHTRWVRLKKRLYFAGSSRRWAGGVAFLSLGDQAGAPGAVGRAYLVSGSDLRAIFRAENGGGGFPRHPSHLGLLPGEWRRVALFNPTSSLGKYNVVLRLDDIEGRPAYTFTTARLLPLNPPDPRYVEVIATAIRTHLDSTAADEYLQRAISDESDPNEPGGPSSEAGLVWCGEVAKGRSAGYPVVRLPRWAAPVDGLLMVLGEVAGKLAPVPVWIAFDRTDAEPASISPSVLTTLAVTPGGSAGLHEITVTYAPVALLKRLGASAADIPPGDVIQLPPNEAPGLGRWALAVTPHFSAPVRIQRRAHVPSSAVRVGYATRQLLALDSEDAFGVQKLPPRQSRRWWARRRPLRALGERLLGAPTVPLRATEGLVGDDGRRVVRVDVTALDFLGVSSGEEAVVTWADRACTARVLLQTPETAEVMRAQLSEETGRQSRTTIGDTASRLATPPHMRAWVSASIRNELGIPPDTVIRLRRSVRHTLRRSAASAALPAAGLVVGSLALPGVPWPVWLGALVVVLALSALPLRLP